jgi:Ca-activated chloride channel family protein
MNFLHLDYIPGLALALVTLAIVMFLLERRFFKMVRTYWFYKRSLFSHLSSFLFFAGFVILFISLLDPRGPEQKIKTEAPTDRTIILIDTSASMLAEDVKPSRLQRAILIAKHFTRKAVGHQVAVVVFAEIQKKIVPFTTDLDLIDSRLESLKNLKNNYGSSALSVAIQESIQYFKETGESRGNLLVLTDGEETADSVTLNVPKEVHVALVGIGTSQGGRIPMDDAQGIRFGYKKNGGKDVVTKLNENFFAKIASDLPSGKFWIANSYTLPSDEIVDFFKSEMIKGKDQQDMIIRPVYMEWFVLPALALLVASWFFKMIRIFTLGMLLVISPSWSEEEKEIKLSPEVIHKMDELQKGKLSRLEKVKLADELYKSGAKAESLELYKENLPVNQIDKTVPPEAYLNYGTGLLENNKEAEGLKVYDKISKSMSAGAEKEKIKDTISKNTLSHFKQQEEKKKKEEQDKKDRKDKKEQNKDEKDKNDQNKQDNQGQNGQQKKEQGGQGNDQKDQKGKGDDQKEKEKKDKGEEKKDDKGEGEDKQDKDQNLPQPDEGEKKPLPPKKMPAKLKQLMSDDRQLQMKVIENGTRELNKRKSRTSKDW